MSSSSTPSLLSEYPSRRVRRNPSMLALNQHSRNALSRMLKHRTYKEELQAFYERQSEGMPSIPNYLMNTVYAELVKQQWLIYTKICNPNKLVAKSTHAESDSSSHQSSSSALPPPPRPPLPPTRLHRTYTTLDLSQQVASPDDDDEDMDHVNMIIESLISDGVSASSSATMNANLKKTPSAQEFQDLQNLINGDSFKLSLVMQDLRLPSAWDLKAKGENIDISRDYMQLTYRGNGKDESDVASVRANYAMRKQCGIYYFEIKVISKGVDGHIGIGFCRRINSLDRFPGWEEHSWGYHGENGHVFSGPGTEKAYGPKYGTGDIIGCGIDFRDMSAFYTKNGIYLGSAFKKVKDTELFPFVGFKTPGEKIEANFGAKPFKFDIYQLLANEKRGLLGRIALKPALTSSRFKIVNNSLANNLADNVVMEYLKHNGYHKAATSLQASIIQKGNLPSVEASNLELDLEATHRQEIRKAIFDGDIDHVFKLCDELYPNVLENNPMILFKLKCRKFIEMIRQAHEQADHAHRDKVPIDAMDYDAALSEEEAQSLQVSENMPSISIKRATSLASLDSEHKRKKQKIAREDLSTFVDGLAYGIELKNAYKEEAKSNRAMAIELESASSILAYTDLTHPKVAPLFETRRIETVASELNSAILVSLGKYPNSSLERIYRQTSATIEELVLSGNAKAALLQPERDCFEFLNG
ncbi:U4/U6-U5 snRNP complex subunit prp31 [Mucor velutinosus]|uniref:U4/U6-U5 snRNP complex subunit prp31 n=1 Tax=Mucor velutinosus TaxID=708070 RepID=A0AAN7DGT4_9FUNG|nr:U4/U6-U5 snRNP complex subunit prp31 [Mucor velutinosus]